jgi:bacterioferritin-associated ferredoxin
MRTGCGATCGSCLAMAQDILDEVHAARALDLLVLDRDASPSRMPQAA